MTRKLPEWCGKTPDTPAPPRVRLRVFEAHGGICHISGRKIRPGEPWDLEHIIALINGGENRESNLAPALRDKHKEKTAKDVAEKAETRRKLAKTIGIKPIGMSKIRSAPFAKAFPQRSASRPIVRKERRPSFN